MKRPLASLKTEFKVFEHDPADLVPYAKIYKESYLGGLARITLQQKDYDKAWSAVKMPEHRETI